MTERERLILRRLIVQQGWTITGDGVYTDRYVDLLDADYLLRQFDVEAEPFVPELQDVSPAEIGL